MSIFTFRYTGVAIQQMNSPPIWFLPMDSVRYSKLTFRYRGGVEITQFLRMIGTYDDFIESALLNEAFE
ncbi:hypothetical protein [Acidithrix ferrooxidans]|uniref:hypothetical protein n=1 Tax=Acidithrix ferrooxidans TaxID=1280514 RepID=UPI001269A0C2|nr:hypothetical protein [Acidithrix ferrooxidans]